MDAHGVSMRFSDVPCPVHYEDAIKSPLAARWHDSMRNEITALLKSGTWIYVSRNDHLAQLRPFALEGFNAPLRWRRLSRGFRSLRLGVAQLHTQVLHLLLQDFSY